MNLKQEDNIERLIALAIKHCDRSHHDWLKLLEIIQDIESEMSEKSKDNWTLVTEKLPDKEPRRKIEIACVSTYDCDDKEPYSIHVSSTLVSSMDGVYAWREASLPEPPTKEE